MGFEIYILAYFAFISLVAFILTVYDKRAAQKNKWRIPEKTLMLVGFFGGAIAMYAAMQLIRHKTKHKKFMLGLPIFMALHIAITVAVFYFI